MHIQRHLLRFVLLFLLVAGCGKDEPSTPSPSDMGADAENDLDVVPDMGDDDDVGGDPTCGDNVVDEGEQCDGDALDGATCGDFGLPDGELSCQSDCTLDTSGCAACDDGICSDSETPTSCPADCAVVDVAAGSSHSCAVIADGSVWCWGARDGHRMGGVGDVREPVRLVEIEGAIEVYAGAQHTCVRTDDDVVCWGANGYGQAGAEVSHEVFPPVSVGNGTEVHVGAFATCVKRSPLVIECFGRLGWGTTTLDAPVQLPGNGLLVMGEHHVCYTDQGRLYCLGRNDHGQLGVGNNRWRDQVDPDDDLVAISPFLFEMGAGADHTCYVLGPAAPQPGLFCWGSNAGGQLGLLPGADALAPEFITSLIPQQLDGGLRHMCAKVFAFGSPLVCWGDNTRGQLGTGVTAAEFQFEQLPIAVDDFDVGARHTCAIVSNGGLKCWGDNSDGQVGVGASDAIIAVPTDIGRFGEEGQ